MTPAATTPAAKAARQDRRSVRPDRVAPAARPRRVSGPVGGATARSAAATIPAPVFAPPRRVTAPPRRVAVPARRRPASSRTRPTVGARAVGFFRALPDHALLDRLIRGRTWIALLGVMLVGIVAMQVEVLKLGASMGRNIELATSLQGHNEALRASVAALADDQRIEALAGKQGMVMPAPADVAFVSPASGATIQRAVSDIHAPAPATFLTATTSNGAVTTLANSNSTINSGTGSGTAAASGTSAPVATIPAASSPASTSH